MIHTELLSKTVLLYKYIKQCGKKCVPSALCFLVSDEKPWEKTFFSSPFLLYLINIWKESIWIRHFVNISVILLF